MGYILATRQSPQPKETFLSPRPVSTSNDGVELSQAPSGHNNMVPFFGARVTQNLQAGAHDSVLDTFSGTGKNQFDKREIASMYDVKSGMGLPFGNQNESDFLQSRQVTSLRMNNVFPVEPVRVGPGLNDGYTNLPSGGYQQFNELQEYAKPRTTDEIRTENNPKLSYNAPPVPGAFYITNPGLQAPVNKNRPDGFGILSKEDGSMPYLLTTGGVQVAPAAYAAQVMLEQNRETTSKEHFGGAGTGFTLASYVRAFTEPFEQFMRLTVGDWMGGAGGGLPEGSYLVDQYRAAHQNEVREASVLTNYQAPGYLAIQAGADGYGATKVNKDESLMIQPRTFQDPAHYIPSVAHTQHQGVIKYTEPLPQGAQIQRMDSSLLDAFRSNPYTQSLHSVA